MADRPDPGFIAAARSLQDAYLEADDPIVQSGFSSGRERWVAERSPLVEGIDRPGSVLDVGCANGRLLAHDAVVVPRAPAIRGRHRLAGWVEPGGHLIIGSYGGAPRDLIPSMSLV